MTLKFQLCNLRPLTLPSIMSSMSNERNLLHFSRPGDFKGVLKSTEVSVYSSLLVSWPLYSCIMATPRSTVSFATSRRRTIFSAFKQFGFVIQLCGSGMLYAIPERFVELPALSACSFDGYNSLPIDCYMFVFSFRRLWSIIVFDSSNQFISTW